MIIYLMLDTRLVLYHLDLDFRKKKKKIVLPCQHYYDRRFILLKKPS